MNTRGLVVLVLAVLCAAVAQADEFIIGAFLDPYSAHGAGASAYVQEYFDSMKAFGVNRVIGVGNDTTTGQGMANSFGRFLVIPSNSIGGGIHEIAVTSQQPRSLERFTTYGWNMTLEAEKILDDPTLKQFGYGFVHMPNTVKGDTIVTASKGTDTAGWFFTGPGETSTHGSGLMWCPWQTRPGTWGRADYVLKLGDTAGVSDTATVARLVVWNADEYFRPIPGYYPLLQVRDTNACLAVDLDSIIYLCHDTTWPTGRDCGPDSYTLKYDDPVFFDLTTNPISLADAYVRDLKKGDFCRVGEWDTLSLHFFQHVDHFYCYSLYWTNKATLTADKVIISNDTGRVFFNLNPDTVAKILDTSYYAKLNDTIPRQYLTDEPSWGSYPVVRLGKDLISWPSISSSNKPTNTIAGYLATVPQYQQWDWLHNIVQVSEYELEVYPINCKMPPDSTTSESDTCSIQAGFAAGAKAMAQVSSKAKFYGKPFWPWVQLFGWYGDSTAGGFRQKTRIPTANEVKAQVNLALAYGAKGILYYQYTTTGDRDYLPQSLVSMPSRLIVPSEGDGGGGCAVCSLKYPRPYRLSGVMKWNGSNKYVKVDTLWDSVRSINVNILKKLGPTLMSLTWDTAGPGQFASASTRGFLNSVTSDKFSTNNMYVEVAHFTGGGADYFMLVNRRCKSYENQTVTAWLNKTDGTMSYVINVLTGDTVLTGGTTGGAPFSTHLNPGEGKLFKVVPYPQQYVHGTVYHKTWQGKITVDGDVTVPTGRTLSILPPKAQVVLLANRDTTHGGSASSKVEFWVNGALIAKGTSTDSIKFVSSASNPGSQDWQGFRIPWPLLTDTGSAMFEYCQFKNAYAALDYYNKSRDTVKNCHFQNNFMYGVHSGNDSLTILNSRFTENGYGVYLDYADDTLRNCLFNNNAYSIYAYKAYGLLSNDSIRITSGYFGEVGLQVEGHEFPPQSNYLTMANCLDSGQFNQAAVIANGNLKIQDSRIKTYGTTPIPDPVPENLAILSLSSVVATVRHSVMSYGGYSVTGPLIRVIGSPIISFGTATDSGKNSIIKGAKSKAIQNDYTPDSIEARYNYWGTSSPSTILFTGKVAFVPYLASPPAKLLAGDYDKPTPLPSHFALNQNYPNPFNPTTTICFSLPIAEKVRLDIYNILGQRVKTLADGEWPAGVHNLVWDGCDENGVMVSSGLYLYKIETVSFREVNRMVFLK